MKRKGALLVTVLVSIVIFIIISVPLTNFIQQSSDSASDNIMENKADEIAYAGFKIFERYVVDYEQDYLGDLSFTDPNVDYGTWSTTITVPYADGTVETPVSITTKATTSDDGKLIERVEVLATTAYSGITGAHEEIIDFQVETMILETPMSVFPYHYFGYKGTNASGARYNPTDGTTATMGKDLAGNVVEPTLKSRMQVETIPPIDRNHIQYILNHENSNVTTITSTPYLFNDVVYESDIMNAIEKLKQSDEEKKSKPWQVIYLDSSKLVSPYGGGSMVIRFDDSYGSTDGYIPTSEDRYTKIDMTGLGNNKDRTSLIFLCDKPLILLPYYNIPNTDPTFLNKYFSVPIYGVATTYYDLINCDMYFISYGTGARGHNFSVYNKDFRNFDELGQITVVSDSTIGYDAWVSSSTNAFFYLPFSNGFAFNGDSGAYTIDSNATAISGNNATYNLNYPYGVISDSTKQNIPMYTFGGAVGDNLGTVGVRNYMYQEEYVPVEWKGDPRLLGYWQVQDEKGTVAPIKNPYGETEYNADYDLITKPETN
ncbi:MAG: hypothetical protein ACK5LV_05230 [Lachnospirales bacterium]